MSVVMLWSASPAGADATLHVNTTADTTSGSACSLREAIDMVNGTAGGGCSTGMFITGTITIVVPAGHYGLSLGPLPVNGAAIIAGAGAGSTVIDAGGHSQVISVNSNGQVFVSDLTITGGLSGDTTGGCVTSPVPSCPQENGNPGGGIVNSGSLTLQSVGVISNQASPGIPPSGGFLAFCAGGGTVGRAGAGSGSGGSGGGIYNTGELTIRDSLLSGNHAGNGGDGGDGVSGTGNCASPGQPGGDAGTGGNGGALFNAEPGSVTIADSTITGNSAGRGGNAGAGSASNISPGTGGDAGSAAPGGNGGAIANLGLLSLMGSTVSGNASGRGGNGGSGGTGAGGAAAGVASPSDPGGAGGMMYNTASQTVQLENDTITGNLATRGGIGGSGAGQGGPGGAIFDTGTLLDLRFVTLAKNLATWVGGGISAAGSVTESDSVIAENQGTSRGNCYAPPGAITDAGHNLVFGDTSCPGVVGDPRLGPLANNGGSTQTMALRAGSAALNLAPPSVCPVTTDQRGLPRPQGVACDAGAYEFAPPAVGAPRVSHISRKRATIGIHVNPDLSSQGTRVTLRWGSTRAYRQPANTVSIGDGDARVTVVFKLRGLRPHHRYHYKVLATNGDGTTVSTDHTFRTRRRRH